MGKKELTSWYGKRGVGLPSLAGGPSLIRLDSHKSKGRDSGKTREGGNNGCAKRKNEGTRIERVMSLRNENGGSKK